jgi:hypothetical protein
MCLSAFSTSFQSDGPTRASHPIARGKSLKNNPVQSIQAYRGGFLGGNWPRITPRPPGTVELRIPKLRQGSYFPAFLEPRRLAEGGFKQSPQHRPSRPIEASGQAPLRAFSNQASCGAGS